MKKIILGIDIGGTKIRAVLLSRQKIIKFYQSKTPNNIKALETILAKLVKRFIHDKFQLLIGIGAAGIVSGKLLIKSPNIKYIKNLDFNRLFSNVLYGLQMNHQVKIDNDARCFLKAEISAVPYLNKGKVLGITLGTGVGRALAKNGKILKIKRLEYPEEWEVRYQKMRDGENNSKLADFLAKKLIILIGAYKPSTIIVGGGVLNRKNFISLLRGALKQHGSVVQVFKSRLEQDSVAIGAVYLYDKKH